MGAARVTGRGAGLDRVHGVLHGGGVGPRALLSGKDGPIDELICVYDVCGAKAAMPGSGACGIVATGSTRLAMLGLIIVRSEGMGARSRDTGLRRGYCDDGAAEAVGDVVCICLSSPSSDGSLGLMLRLSVGVAGW